jgi:LAO/AO transport system kinase
VPVLLCSALQREGVVEAWNTVEAFRATMQSSGEFAAKRALQNSDWMWTLLMDDLKETFLRHPKVEALLPQLQESVAAGVTTPGAAARRLLEVFRRG